MFQALTRIFFMTFVFAGATGNSLCCAANSDDVAYSAPASSFKASSGVRLMDTSKSESITHTNVTVDDTRENAQAEVQERTEFESANTVKVLNNMGRSGNLYTAGQLESKTGQPTTKAGVEKIAKGTTVRFSATGTEIVEPDSWEVETPGPSSKPAKEEKKSPRVFVS